VSEYLTTHGTRETPQDERAVPEQTPNSEGGYVWPLDDLARLRRFLILGSEGGSYYATERELTKENVGVVHRLARENGRMLVDEVVAVSEGGRAPRNEPALFALACAISLGDKATRRAAAEALPRVARIGTHLYHFVAYAETMRGWGRTMRWAVSNWYDRNPEQLALQAVKYRQRDGWSHRDLLRLAHPGATVSTSAIGPEGQDTEALRGLFGWIAQNPVPEGSELVHPSDWNLPDLVRGFALAQEAGTPARTAELVREYGLPREALLTEHLADPEVWRALLDEGMPTTALVRNLGNMTRLGVLEGEYLAVVTAALADAEQIRRSRIHPLAVLVALSTYAAGRGQLGRNVWYPVSAVTDALDGAFYLAFGNVEPTGKRILVALDVSGSMDGGSVAGSFLTPREAASALALVAVNTETNVDVVTFSSSTPGGWRSGRRSRWVSHGLEDGIEPYGLSRRQRLDDVVRATSQLRMGGTDCALPMLYAIDEQRDYDVFQVYTDSETWAGDVHPFQALRSYREQRVPDARLAVVAMVSNGFTIADPSDAGMLDVVGMDTATPQVLAEFAAGRL